MANILFMMVVLGSSWAFGAKVTCTATISWRDIDSAGNLTTKAESKTLSAEVDDDGESRTIDLHDSVVGNEERLTYFLEMGKDRHVATLRVRDASIQSHLLPGDWIRWALGDPYGGAEMEVKCRHVGNSQHNGSAISCRALSVRMPRRFGDDPAVEHFPAQTTNSGKDFHKLEFGDLTVSTNVSGKRGSVWLGEMSDHVIDTFSFSLLEGKTIGIRDRKYNGYDDYMCVIEKGRS